MKTLERFSVVKRALKAHLLNEDLRKLFCCQKNFESSFSSWPLKALLLEPFRNSMDGKLLKTLVLREDLSKLLYTGKTFEEISKFYHRKKTFESFDIMGLPLKAVLLAK